MNGKECIIDLTGVHLDNRIDCKMVSELFNIMVTYEDDHFIHLEIFYSEIITYVFPNGATTFVLPNLIINCRRLIIPSEL
ncbi:Nuclear hormone receptor [Dirofilaria immitis]